ncbi:MAG: ComEC/Rec2 family competence protein [Sphingobacteriia bacterium]
MPLLWAALALAAGIGAAGYVSLAWGWAALALAALAARYLSRRLGMAVWWWCLWAVWFMLGASLMQQGAEEPAGHLAHLTPGPQHLRGELLSPPVPSRTGPRAWLAVHHVRRAGHWQPATGQLLLQLPQGCTQQALAGQWVEVQGSLAPLAHTGYWGYLRRQGLSHRLRSYCPRVLARAGWRIYPSQLQHHLSQQLGRYLPPGPELAVARAILLGEMTELGGDLRQAYNSGGVTHVLSLSGLHMSLLSLLLYFFMDRLLPPDRWRYLRLGGVCLLLALYACMTGLSPPVVRAVLLSLAVVGARLLLRRPHILNLLGACCLLQLLASPRLFYNYSFQLSYAAVAGIVLLTPLLYQAWRPRATAWQWVYGCLVVSLAAQLFTLPLSLHHFGTTSLYFLPVNLLFTPIVFIAMLVGLLFLFFHPFYSLAALLAWVVYGSLWAMNHTVYWVQALPWALVHIRLSAWQAGLLAAAIVLPVLGAWLYRARFRRNPVPLAHEPGSRD